MRRALLSLAGILAIAWFQFEVYPGHTYLQGDTQILAPQLERLETPGFLSRDLVATHPNLTYTLYDEATLALRRVGHMELEQAMAAQQFACRFAGLLGVALLAGTLGIGAWWPLGVAALTGFIGALPGFGGMPFETEPVPRSFAFALVLLAAGLFARGKPLLAGLAGGVAIIYDVRLALPFWLILAVAGMADRSLRRAVRAMLPILTVFALLLANFAQWQPITLERGGLFERVPPAIEAVQRFRLPALRVSDWEPRAMFFYVCLAVLSAWSLRRLWGRLNRPSRWLLTGFSVVGTASVPLSLALFEGAHLRAVPLLHPTRALLFLTVSVVVSCAAAALQTRTVERWIAAAALLLVIAASWIPLRNSAAYRNVLPAARWAHENTWGGSMFLFPDAAKDLAPGVFRAAATRAVWVDWETGNLATSSDLFADEWLRRWRDTMQDRYSTVALKRYLSLPIDYCVLTKEHSVAAAKPVYADAHWSIYDARELRTLLHVPAY